MAVNHNAGKVRRMRVADQIVEDLRAQILSRALPAGTKLPAERELAAQYGVSGPTIREAIRVLTAVGLVSSKNGRGSIVTAQSETLIAVSIASVVQFQQMGPRDVFGLLGVLYAHAVELAARQASEEEIAALREAAERASVTTSVEQAATDVKNYFLTLSRISHNPLLDALCRFIVEVQIGLAVELSDGSLSAWNQVAGGLQDHRGEIVEALADRDAMRAADLVQKYHERVIGRMQTSSRAQEIAVSDPVFSQFLGSWLAANVILGSEPTG